MVQITLGGDLLNRLGEEERPLRNPRDADCDEGVIETCMRLHKEGRETELLRLLAKHKASLLNKVHSSQHRVDCLDYLAYEIKKKIRIHNERFFYEHQFYF